MHNFRPDNSRAKEIFGLSSESAKFYHEHSDATLAFYALSYMLNISLDHNAKKFTESHGKPCKDLMFHLRRVGWMRENIAEITQEVMDKIANIPAEEMNDKTLAFLLKKK